MTVLEVPDDALEALPVFPLPQVTLFPGARLPLHIFEPRYRKMTSDCLAGHRAMAVTQLLGPGQGGTDPPIAIVAGVGMVVEAEPLPDGRFNLVLEGCARVRLFELPFVAPYRRARALLLGELLSEPAGAEVAALSATARAFVAFVRARDPDFRFVVPEAGLPGPRLADLCAQRLILDASDRQSALELLDPAARVCFVRDVLAGQLARLGGRSGPSAGAN
ncbi:MAG: LON peptidase substrate-binding domain-containing protein [Myxococcales bacterium]|nr:LON peptidase substrate-binding domain-containing protein [Myxococcales bacterium]